MSYAACPKMPPAIHNIWWGSFVEERTYSICRKVRRQGLTYAIAAFSQDSAGGFIDYSHWLRIRKLCRRGEAGGLPRRARAVDPRPRARPALACRNRRIALGPGQAAATCGCAGDKAIRRCRTPGPKHGPLWRSSAARTAAGACSRRAAAGLPPLAARRAGRLLRRP